MNRVMGTLAIMLSITGCTTTPGLMRANAPHVLEVSNKDVKTISICIADKWEKYGVVNQRETRRGISLTTSIGGKLLYLADIELVKDVTITKAYKYLQYSPDANPLLVAVSDCQA